MLAPCVDPLRIVRELSQRTYGGLGPGHHLVLMYERLPPKEIARIKRERRLSRIRHLRQVVATGAVSLVAIFSGVLLTRSLTEQSSSSQAVVSRPAVVATSPPAGESEDDSDTAAPATTPAPAPTPTPVVTSQS